MMYDKFFADAISRLRDERRYRVFADLERIAGRFPWAVWHSPQGRRDAKYMVKRRGPPSQGWRTFLHNHAPDIAAMDLFVVPTIGFGVLYAFVIVRLGRRDLVWINVTAYPTAD